MFDKLMRWYRDAEVWFAIGLSFAAGALVDGLLAGSMP